MGLVDSPHRACSNPSRGGVKHRAIGRRRVLAGALQRTLTASRCRALDAAGGGGQLCVHACSMCVVHWCWSHTLPLLLVGTAARSGANGRQAGCGCHWVVLRAGAAGEHGATPKRQGPHCSVSLFPGPQAVSLLPWRLASVPPKPCRPISAHAARLLAGCAHHLFTALPPSLRGLS